VESGGGDRRSEFRKMFPWGRKRDGGTGPVGGEWSRGTLRVPGPGTASGNIDGKGVAPSGGSVGSGSRPARDDTRNANWATPQKKTTALLGAGTQKATTRKPHKQQPPPTVPPPNPPYLHDNPYLTEDNPTGGPVHPPPSPRGQGQPTCTSTPQKSHVCPPHTPGHTTSLNHLPQYTAGPPHGHARNRPYPQQQFTLPPANTRNHFIPQKKPPTGPKNINLFFPRLPCSSNQLIAPPRPLHPPTNTSRLADWRGGKRQRKSPLKNEQNSNTHNLQLTPHPRYHKKRPRAYQGISISTPPPLPPSTAQHIIQPQRTLNPDPTISRDHDNSN